MGLVGYTCYGWLPWSWYRRRSRRMYRLICECLCCQISLQSICLVWDFDHRGLMVVIAAAIEHLYIYIIRFQSRQSPIWSTLWLWCRIRQIRVFPSFQCLGYTESVEFGVFDLGSKIWVSIAPDTEKIEECRGSLEGICCLSGSESARPERFRAAGSVPCGFIRSDSIVCPPKSIQSELFHVHFSNSIIIYRFFCGMVCFELRQRPSAW